MSEENCIRVLSNFFFSRRRHFDERDIKVRNATMSSDLFKSLMSDY